MSDCERRLRQVCAWNHRLSRENSLLRIKVHRMEQEIRALEAANANLLVERVAINVVLGAAMDEALRKGAQA
jgi:hypothetical protein